MDGVMKLGCDIFYRNEISDLVPCGHREVSPSCCCVAERRPESVWGFSFTINVKGAQNEKFYASFYTKA